MSSVYVRTQVKAHLQANSSEKVVDLTSQYEYLDEILADAGIDHTTGWIGLDFIGDDEVPATLPATPTSGRYREHGVVQVHVVAQAKLGAGSGLLTRGETLRDLFRGRRINGVTVESVSPLNTHSGATLQFEGGWMSGTFLVSYQYDKNL